ncbi:MAG: 6,7-dimethyl-8-ribityllumazine synthase [Candidatus Koribacter versatilis]|nr:6,7-dimethyl-8-ribityllumazine synthase [Candidatus Koribacter versatilis]
MLKSLHIGRYVGDPEDLRVLAEFLQAIGFESVAGEDGRSAILSAPMGLLSLNSLAKEYPAAVRERLKDVNRLLVIEVTNPDAVFDIAKKRKFKLLADASHPKTGERSFSLDLPGEIVVTIHGKPEEPVKAVEGELNAAGKRFAVVVSRFNAFITDRLLQGALDGLRRSGAAEDDITVMRVPGSFEISSAARTLAETKKYDAIICLGCLLRGGTAHYDVIANEVTRGIGQSAQGTGVPHAFGVLTCDTLEQAIDRAGLKMGNKGFEAALAAVEMASLKKAVSSQHSAVRKAGGRWQVAGVRKTAARKKTHKRRKS